MKQDTSFSISSPFKSFEVGSLSRGSMMGEWPNGISTENKEDH